MFPSKFKYYKLNSCSGFSLIEFLVYIAVVSLVLGSAFTLYVSIVNLRSKNQSLAEVEQQGQQILQLINQTLRNSSGVTSPAVGLNGASMTINTYSSSTSPTVFSVVGGAVSVQEGSSSPVSLNSSRVSVSNLNFQNLTRTGTGGIVRVSFTLSYNNTNSRGELTYVKNFYGGASIRGVYP